MGWVVDYICRLKTSYSEYTLDYIMFELPMLQGMILYSWAYANCPIHLFSGIQMVGGGYSGMEADELLRQLKEMKAQQQV
jgi:hypothetical protein